MWPLSSLPAELFSDGAFINHKLTINIETQTPVKFKSFQILAQGEGKHFQPVTQILLFNSSFNPEFSHVKEIQITKASRNEGRTIELSKKEVKDDCLLL